MMIYDYLYSTATDSTVHVWFADAANSKEIHFIWSGPEDWVYGEEPANWLQEEGEMATTIIMHVEEGTSPRVELYNLGATCHISPYKSNFTSYISLSPPVPLNMANQQCFQAMGMGSLTILIPNGGTDTELVLRNVLHVLLVAYTLILLRVLDAEGYHMTIGGGHLNIITPHGQKIGQVTCTPCRLYHITHMPESANTIELLSIMELHCHLGHITTASAHKLVKSRAITGVKLDPTSKESDCDVCTFACMTCLPISKVQISPPAQSFGEEIHTNVWGPSSIVTHQGQRYFISFMGNMMCYTVAFLLCKKSEAFELYKTFESCALTQQHCKVIKTMWSDCGGKYLSKVFDRHLAAAGTTHRLTVHDTPQLNGIAEHLNCMLLEQVWAFTHLSSLPKSLWGEALWCTVWLKNHMGTCALNSKMPYEVLHGHPPNLSNLCIWGCQVWIHSTSEAKLNIHAHQACWLGFNLDVHTHHIYWPDSGHTTIEHNIYFRLLAPLEGSVVMACTFGSNISLLATQIA
jgi:hypothetical protein